MSSMLIAIAVVLISLNVAVSALVALASHLSRSQKTFQILGIWLLPFVGAIVCGAVSRTQAETLQPASFDDWSDGGGMIVSDPGIESGGCDGGGGCD